MKTLSFLCSAITIAALGTSSLRAGDTPAPNPSFAALSAVSPAELPAKAAELVARVDAKNLAATTVNVVKAAVGLNPAAAAAIVGSIAQSTPQAVAVAAGTAAKLMPDEAVAIARAAAAAAPSQAGKIVEAVCRVLPKTYSAVANAAAEAAPSQGKAILAGVCAAIPTLRGSINQAVAGYNGANPSVSDVLGQTSIAANPPTATPAVSSAIMPAAQFGPPYVPAPASPVNYSAGSGGQELPGGHGSSSP